MDVRSLTPQNNLHRWFPDNKRVTSFNSCVDRWFHAARDQVTSSQDMFAEYGHVLRAAGRWDKSIGEIQPVCGFDLGMGPRLRFFPRNEGKRPDAPTQA